MVTGLKTMACRGSLEAQGGGLAWSGAGLEDHQASDMVTGSNLSRAQSLPGTRVNRFTGTRREPGPIRLQVRYGSTVIHTAWSVAERRSVTDERATL